MRKDAIFKCITNCSNPAFVITPVDPNSALAASEASSFTLIKQPSSTFHPGIVPKVKIEALKYRNKKITRVSGLELYQIDLQEFARYLRNKCQASVTIHEITPSQKQLGANIIKGVQFREIQIQGQMITQIEEALTQRYVVLQKYMEISNKLPDKKKKKR